MDNNPPDEKFDRKQSKGKTIWLDMQWKALKAIAEVFTYALKKYGNVNTWRNRNETSEQRYFDALMRHLIAHRNGEIFDPESRLPHLAHAAWNILTLLEFQCEDFEKGKPNWRQNYRESPEYQRAIDANTEEKK